MNLDRIRRSIHPIHDDHGDYDALLDMIGDAQIVCIGEASHGTHEFYRERAKITRRLIEEKGFHAVAVEADWPDAYRVNRYVRGMGNDGSANEALEGFLGRFPTWMWRNSDVLDFVGWLRSHNDSRDDAAKVGFYGVDLYSLFSSIEAVIQYLEQVDPEGAKHARRRYSCFDHYADEAQAYGYATAYGISQSCQDAVVTQLTELRQRASELANRDGQVPPDEFFYAEQNARLVANAEEYYRSMFAGRASSWNLRDRHMAETIDHLVAYLGKDRERAKIVVWEHNSHLGDARFTEMGQQGELNVGQLMRERYGDGAVLIGFSTYHGTVTAADDWDAPARRKRVRPGLRDSYEDVLHQVSESPYYLLFRGEHNEAVAELDPQRLQRAIGVIYRPETERQSHYFRARLPRQFDAMIHFDETRALEPLERTPGWHTGEPPETYPSGI